MDINTFYRKWNNKTLEDAGSVVSSEYRGFQTSLTNLIKGLAKEAGANVVEVIKGHYYESYMIERNGKYCYVHKVEPLFQRTHIVLDKYDSFLIRTAGHAKDWRGGTNEYCTLKDLPEYIDTFLNMEHRSAF